MLEIIETGAFGRDIKQMQKRGKDLSKLLEIVSNLANRIPLQAKHRPHPLKGNWKPKWECHIEPDWLLVYEITETELRLARTGSHSDLFR